MKRTEKTIQQYKEQLKDKGINNILEFVELIISADITKGKYTRFLLDCFLADKFRMEDLQGGLESTIGQAVSLFHKHKAKLPEEMRSINKYSSPGELWQAVREYEQVLTGKEEKQAEKEKAYTETEFVYHDEDTGFQIISPLTEYAAKWWGKGTRWCTSAEKNNMFLDYAKYAPLFIIIMPDNSKLQLWKYKNKIQFMDEADNSVNLNYIENNWQLLKELCVLLENDRFIPEKYLTVEICQKIIAKDQNFLYKVPEELRTSEFYKGIIKQNANILSYIYKEEMTHELYQLAMQQDGLTLEYIPTELKNSKFCTLAVQQNGKALKFVPDEYITPELCQLSVASNGLALYGVPNEYITHELCKIAVKQDGFAIRFVPEKYITYELYKLAIEQDGMNLSYVPKAYITSELCEIVVQKNGFFLDYVPEEKKTPEIYEMAVQQNGMVLYYVPEKYRTFELCNIAIKQNGYALPYVPKKYITPELCRLAIEQNGDALIYAPNEFITLELCEIAVQNGAALAYVPKELRTQKICELAEPQLPLNIRDKIKNNISEYTEQYNEIRSLFPEQDISYNP